METKLLYTMLIVFMCGNANSQNLLDLKFSPLLKFGRKSLNSILEPRSFTRTFELNKRFKKVQQQFTEDSTFFCDVKGAGARSKIVPKSVHELRPGDIDIVGAIGDSLTSGNGILAVDTLQLLLEGRGQVWSIGGQNSWRKFLTIPNILKEFNPKLYGYPENNYGNADEKSSRFNVATLGAMISDTVHQTKNLVKRMRSDEKVNIKQHWKLITYMIGSNDFCLDICYYQNQEKAIDNAGKNLLLALRILKNNLPRTMINIVLPPDVTLLTRLTNKPPECQSLHYFECPCFFSLSHFNRRDILAKTITKWQKHMAEIARLPEFHDQIDFEVNVHPFLVKTDIPKDSQGNTDYSYMSKDCFHLSQLGHARAANSYWNSMLTSQKERSLKWDTEFQEFKCPTLSQPFLKTSKNSL